MQFFNKVKLMKKFSALLLALIFIIQLPATVGAYFYEGSGSAYTMELPEDYREVSTNSFMANDNSTLNVNITENEEDYCIADNSEKKLSEIAKAEAKVIGETFKAMGKAGGTDVVSVSKIKHQSGKTALVILYNTYMVKDGEKVSHLQKAYTFSCEDNVYSFVYTPHNDKDIDKFDSSFDSINIPEPEIKSIVSKIKEACIVAVFFLLIILGIVRFLRTPAKRKKGKL